MLNKLEERIKEQKKKECLNEYQKLFNEGRIQGLEDAFAIVKGVLEASETYNDFFERFKK